MKKILIILVCLFSLNTFFYASFPIAENGSFDISNTINFKMVEHEQFSFEPFLGPIFIFVSSLMLYFLWKWKKKNRNLPIVKINWSKLHLAWKALLILISLYAVSVIFVIIALVILLQRNWQIFIFTSNPN